MAEWGRYLAGDYRPMSAMEGGVIASPIVFR